MVSPLRELTRAEHDRVDLLYSQFKLDAPASYASFLLAQGAAHCAVEAELERAGVAGVLADWPARRRSDLVAADLGELGLRVPERVFGRHLAGLPQILGAVYVLEGSRLGGKVLAKRLYPGAPRRFLAAVGGRSAWPLLVNLLNQNLQDPGDLMTAATAAKDCFACFERSAVQQGEQEIA